MVKNDAGGNKGKGLARKHVNAAKGGGSKQLRVATDAAEKYAVVNKMLGNGMCYVSLLDGTIGSKLCIIRNKFKGRGKRDNILNTGSWVLVGLRDWSSKQDTCDLLEVYNDGERDRLMKNEPCFKSVAANESNNEGSSGGGNVVFADNETMKYSALVKRKLADQDDDDDDELMQQRVYDMPPSESESESESEESEESSDSDLVSVPTPAASLPSKPKIEKMDYINVDDI